MDLMSAVQVLGDLGDFVGAIAVVVTLAYLAVQVRHSKEATEANTRAMQVQAYQAWQAANLEINQTLSNQSKMITAGNYASTNLTEESYLAFAMTNLSIMQMAQLTDYLYRRESLDRELWESEIDRAAGILAMPGVRQWWDAGGKTNLTQQFVQLLESTQSRVTFWTWDSERGYFPSDLRALQSIARAQSIRDR